jgi:small-conductance mechanosensitive channel
MDWLGIHWVGINPETGHKLLVTILLLLFAFGVNRLGHVLIGAATGGHHQKPVRFWSRQALGVIVAVLTVFGLLSVWLDNPERLTTAMGLATAGIAFALQKVITSLAGYVVIMRGKTFTVGDRITMGGVRGDVVALGFMQTTIMEMGQPPSVQNADPAMWVRSRQFTGRIVTVANSRIFDEPVYNYTRDFPYIWEEVRLPVGYRSDHAAAEHILLDVARRHAVTRSEVDVEATRRLRDRYSLDVEDVEPRVFYRLTDNWIELSVRFLAGAHGVREVKDRMSRDLLAALARAGIDVASSTYEIVGMPALHVRLDASQATKAMRAGNEEAPAQPTRRRIVRP